MFTLLVDEQRYGKASTYWPNKILVDGTLEQARNFANFLSNYEAGCDDYWYVKEDQ